MTDIIVKNIFADIPVQLPDELFEDIIVTHDIKLERIISECHSTPEGQWYDQDRNEWVLLLQGSAGLRFEGNNEIINLMPGDYLSIEAHLKHRVEYTDKSQKTIWLALHY